MRLVLAIISFTLAAVFIGFGIAQRTVLAGPDHVTAAVETSSDATVTVIDGAVLNSFDQTQTVEASGADTIFAAYGRTEDVLAWVGDASYNEIGLDAETLGLTSTLVEGTETEVPNPAGSDLWLADYSESNELRFTINVPEDISVIVVSDGIAPAPAELSVTWLIDNSTPFAIPLVVGGGILLLLGLIFLLWAINHVRRARGPRRKQLRLPKVPRPPGYKAIKRGAPTPAAITRGRRSARMVAVLPVSLVGVLLLGACSSPLQPKIAPSISATAEAEEEAVLDAPAVTVPQAKRIVARISASVAEADAASDATLLAERMAGPALALRTANYAIRKVDAATPAPPAIPSGPVKITLPQQNDMWPRTVLAVIQDEADETIAPVALVLIQENARAQYKVHYAIALEPGAVIPDVAPAVIGAPRLDPDSLLFTITPSEIVTAYGDILMKDTESEWFEFFEAEGDTLRVAVGKADHDRKIAGLPTTAQLTFSNALGEGQIVALATNDGGALVALPLNEIEEVKPVETGAAVNAPAQVAALLGKALSTKGLRAVYGDQLLFYVPPASIGGPIILLGYSQGLISAAEL